MKIGCTLYWYSLNLLKQAFSALPENPEQIQSNYFPQNKLNISIQFCLIVPRYVLADADILYTC